MNYWNLTILLLALISSQVQSTTVYACSTNSTVKLRRFAKTHLCVHFAPYHIKIGINTSVDKAQTVRIQDAYTNFQSKAGDSYMMVQQAGSNTYSTKVPYIKPTDNRIYPLNFLNIVMKEGNVSAYQWGNICDGCGTTSTTCFKETASTLLFDGSTGAYEQSNCFIAKCTSSNYASCDPRIFVTWSGTDSDKKYLLSYGKALKMFTNQSIGSLWSSMNDGDMTLTPDGNSLDPDVAARIDAIS